ncbi:hypothetical protein PIB30_043789 [Stylosanthes scabra]|uniref:Uncharacterized protein n=1 Tax=Stylosanthes scabra TaxID=79078 RepID=A0ABU6SFI4_9FABA|nr:hypothetical protein [Stylosanthes scabra]
MEVAIAVPIHSMDFNFHSSNCSSPFITAPSTPQQQQQNFDGNTNHFEFEFSGQLQRSSISPADELFHCGMIRPLNTTTTSSIDEPITKGSNHRRLADQDQDRGREPQSQSQSQSQSPPQQQNQCKKDKKGLTSFFSETAISSLLSSIWLRKGFRKWRIKDILLFRSASEGRCTDKDALTKYMVLSKTKLHYNGDDDVGNLSFRSVTTTAEENSGSVSKRRVSAHELHYTVNRAASEELKKKTLLPYKHGLLGCLSFNATSDLHLISSRVMSMERS